MEKLIITNWRNYRLSALFEEKELISIQAERKEQESLLGNLYIAKVKNIVTNINAAFVEIEGGVMAYYPLAPKDEPVFVKRSSQAKICVGDEFFVQVERENVKTKQPVVTANFSLTGKYLVLLHGERALHISSKLPKNETIRHFKELLSEGEPGCGFILRTNAQYATEEQLLSEKERLCTLHRELCTKGIHKSCFSMVYRELPPYVQQIRDEYTDRLSEIVTDDRSLYETIRQYLEAYQPEDLKKLRFYEDATLSLTALYGLEKRIEELSRELVWLKSGANIVIQPTEALTVIDVNTGKAISGKTAAEETFLKINKEAAVEIAKQIRLRNLSGIIIVDFIDMEEKASEKELLSFFDGLCKKDPIKTTVVDMTALNLVELTRKKVRKPFHEQICEKN